jgi:hypothetical protein
MNTTITARLLALMCLVTTLTDSTPTLSPYFSSTFSNSTAIGSPSNGDFASVEVR